MLDEKQNIKYQVINKEEHFCKRIFNLKRVKF